MKLTPGRINELRKRYTPAGWAVQEWEKDGGLCNINTKIMKVPKLVTPEALQIFLHECGHVHLGHYTLRGAGPLHVEEFEAERWSFEIMRQNGITVPRWVVVEGKVYVRTCIYKDRQKGIDIQKHVEKWAHS